MKACALHCGELIPPWLPSFPVCLAKHAERRVLAPKEMTINAYSTARFLDPPICGASENVSDPVWSKHIEILNQSAAASFHTIGLHFLSASDIHALRVEKVLEGVAVLLKGLPCISESITSLVRAIHIIESSGPGFDTSFSDPIIPFSIFVSVPKLGEKNRLLRVLEAIVHECMHLQLSCYELINPLVHTNADEALWYSPWKKAKRRVQGILHGMYVFHVVAYVYSELLNAEFMGASDTNFAQQRLTEIALELAEVRGVEDSRGLTRDGLDLMQAILNPKP